MTHGFACIWRLRVLHVKPSPRKTPASGKARALTGQPMVADRYPPPVSHSPKSCLGGPPFAPESLTQGTVAASVPTLPVGAEIHCAMVSSKHQLLGWGLGHRGTTSFPSFPSPFELRLGFCGAFAAAKAGGNKNTFPLSPSDKLLSRCSPQNSGQPPSIRSIWIQKKDSRQAITRKSGHPALK